MELDQIAGIPAHPLLVHIPVVLIPLASIALVLIAVSSSAHLRLRWYVLGLTFVATLGTLLAAGSGEELEHNVERSAVLREHTELGDQMRPIALLLLLAVIGLIAVTHFTTRRSTDASVGAAVSSQRSMSSVLRAVLIVGAVALATLNTVWIIRTGHEGAKATWAEETAERGERTTAGSDAGDDDGDDDGGEAGEDGLAPLVGVTSTAPAGS
ncbi:MAG: DUF2231 domain-containing protein [Acidimicrobiia bacterium]